MNCVIKNPKIRYPNGFKTKDNTTGEMKNMYDEDICILYKRIDDDVIAIVHTPFSYHLIINDFCNRIHSEDLGKVIDVVISKDSVDGIVNKINSFGKYWINECDKPKGVEVKVIDYDNYSSSVYDDEKAFVMQIKKDISMFHSEYPYHDLRCVDVHIYNKECYHLSFFLDDCDMEHFLNYVVYKKDIERIVKQIKKEFNVDVINDTGEQLLKTI